MKGEYAMPRSEASKKQQAEYSVQYMKTNVTQCRLNINKKMPEDLKILDWINSQPEGTSPYLRRLVQEDMSRAASEKANVDQ